VEIAKWMRGSSSIHLASSLSTREGGKANSFEQKPMLAARS
jgi:hypothetical protein